MALRAFLLSLVLVGASVAPASAIVGGQPAQRDYPGLAQLYVDGAFACGANLVRPDWVLTAAHCMEDPESGVVFEPGKIEIRLGRRELNADGGEVHAVAQVVQHESYDGNAFDIGLLRLARPSAYAPYRIISLTERDRWAPGVEATIAGWGSTSYGGGPSNELREVQVPIVDDGSCETTGATPTDFHRATMFCAGDTFGGRDSCSGDSGGPLLVPDATQQPAIAGIVSFGLGCAFPLLYGVYGRVGDETLNSWLNTKLPPPPPGSPAPPPPSVPLPPGATPTPAAPPTPAPKAVRVVLGDDLGSARAATKRRRVRVRIRTSAPLRNARLRLIRRNRTVGGGTVARINRRTTATLKLRGKAARGKYLITFEALDAAGNRVRAARNVRLR